MLAWVVGRVSVHIQEAEGMNSPFVRADEIYRKYLAQRGLTFLVSQEERADRGSFPGRLDSVDGVKIHAGMKKKVHTVYLCVVCASIAEDDSVKGHTEVVSEEKAVMVASMENIHMTKMVKNSEGLLFESFFSP
jgi:hypothetical protein